MHARIGAVQTVYRQALAAQQMMCSQQHYSLTFAIGWSVYTICCCCFVQPATATTNIFGVIKKRATVTVLHAYASAECFTTADMNPTRSVQYYYSEPMM
jgi:hypothetical protein